MFPDSVVSRTGQFWKLALSVVIMLVGSFAPFWEASHLSWTVATILVCVVYAWALLDIRCPECRNRWFWSAALDARWYGPLMKAPVCPACKRDFSSI